MPVGSEENIVKLQISVDDTILVEILESQANLGGVESAMKDARLVGLRDFFFLIATMEIVRVIREKGMGVTYWARFVPNWPR